MKRAPDHLPGPGARFVCSARTLYLHNRGFNKEYPMSVTNPVYAARSDDPTALKALEVLGGATQRQQVLILAKDAPFPRGCIALVGVPKRTTSEGANWYARVSFSRPSTPLVPSIEESLQERPALYIEVRAPRQDNGRYFRKGVKQARSVVERFERRRARMCR